MHPSTKLKKRWIRPKELGRSLFPGQRVKPSDTLLLLFNQGLIDNQGQPLDSTLQQGLARSVSTAPGWIEKDSPAHQEYTDRVEWHQQKVLAFLENRGIQLASEAEQRARLMCDQLATGKGSWSQDSRSAEWQRGRFEEHLQQLQGSGEKVEEFMVTLAQLLTERIGEAKTERCLEELGWKEALRAYQLEKTLPEPEPSKPSRLRF